MADRELKRLSRAELIDIIYALKEREESLSNQVAALQEALSRRDIEINQAGSIAEAALKINQVFEQAQKAADDYLRSVRLAADKGTLEPQALPEEKPEEPPKAAEAAGQDKPELPRKEEKVQPDETGKMYMAPPEDRTAQARQKFESRLSGLFCRTEKGGGRQ